MRRISVVASALLVSALMAGCQGDAEPPISTHDSTPVAGVSTPPSSAPETALESILRLARENGAYDDQIAMLETAVARGSVEFVEVRAAVDATYQCLDEAGIGYIEEPRDPDRPYASIAFSIEIAQPTDDALSDACVYGHSFWIQSAFEQQPVAAEAADEEFNRARPVMIACLVEHGLEADDTLTNAELKELLIYSETGIDRTGDATPPESWEPMGCIQAGGLTGF